jgi:hypothetical protein
MRMQLEVPNGEMPWILKLQQFRRIIHGKITDLPHGAKTVGVKWVYKTKLNERGKVDKYKACLVAKGYTQQYGVDYMGVLHLWLAWILYG